MPGWLELAYTTGGGVVGAVLTNHLARTQERRGLRAEVMRQLLRLATVRDGVSGIVPRTSGRPARSLPGEGRRATERLAVEARLADGGDAEHALREAISDLVVAALAAGVPRRILDFAGGAEERALQTEVIRLADAEHDGVLGDSLADLVRRTDRYRQATAQHLLRTLWRPWYGRLAMRLALPTLRREAGTLHQAQLTAVAALADRTDPAAAAS